MSYMNLTQADLNESLRGLTNVDIMMFLPDKDIYFPSNAVTVNQKALSYTSNLQSLIEFSSLPQANIATFENNSWILDGSFISPSEAYSGGGDSYSGYISNKLTDDNGDYSTNPVITVTLAAVAPVIKYLSFKFAGGIDTSYPKTFKIRTLNAENTMTREFTINMSEMTTLPLLTIAIGEANIKKLEFEFIGTMCPHRRSRLSKIMFGKVEQVDPTRLQSWSIDDKASLVADSIPTKAIRYSIIDYEGMYDIDNPGNKIPEVYKDTLILFTFSMEKDGLWKYMPTKTFNLTDISTSSEGVVTFEGGSILDVLTSKYDHDIYEGSKTIAQIMNKLLSFSGIGTDQCILNEFSNYRINIPLPEDEVRTIIQKLAFSCGATLTVNDQNKIVFSKKNIIPTSNTSKFMFNQPVPFNSAGVLLEEPKAEALSHTTDLAMYTYDTRTDEESSEVGSADISVTTPTRITFPAVAGSIQFSDTDLQEQNARITSVEEIYSQHAIISINWQSPGEAPIRVKMYGRKANVTKTIPKTATMDTLLLDSGITRTIPTNLIRPSTNPDSSTFYYTDWYGAKFKYVCKTRGEYLINAGDIILFETPYSNGEPSRVGYVLRNSYSSGDSGEMEVITVGND